MELQAADIGYREMSFHLADIQKIIKQPDQYQQVTSEAISAMRDLHAAALEAGFGEDGFIRLTLAPEADRVDAMRETAAALRSYARGECTEFVDVEDFQ
ncbi:hypothetical protein HAP94_13465 [Acidithiobacillus ferrivorans]|nr:hypothetical protein [Acidithiobacillus ferrivorans]